MPTQTNESPKFSLAVLAAIRAFAIIVSARLLLLLALAGAFTLALLAQTSLGLAVLVTFAVLVVLPLVYLDFASRQRPP